MKCVKDLTAAFRKELVDLYSVKEVDSLSMIVIAEITGTSSAKIKAFPELELPQQHLDAINNILIQLKTGKPIQYILGHAEFYGLTFKVNPSVLIPRPETEELVEWVISSVDKNSNGSILDIGTGSGCIAISLKKNLSDYDVSAIDISNLALGTAKENAQLNGVHVNFIEADILNPKFEIGHSKFEIIVSNPPYVTLEDKKQMHANVTNFEPHTALFVPEDDPLIFYKAIVDFALKYLKIGGLLFFEINESYGKEIVDMINSKLFKKIELRKDMSEKYRMAKAQFLG